MQIATLTQQMRSVAASVEDIKRSVQPYADLDRGFAEMRVRAESVPDLVKSTLDTLFGMLITMVIGSKEYVFGSSSRADKQPARSRASPCRRTLP